MFPVVFVLVSMKIIVWNCQGAASKRFFRAAMSIIKVHKPDCFCLLEPKMSGDNADKVCFKFGFELRQLG